MGDGEHRGGDEVREILCRAEKDDVTAALRGWDDDPGVALAGRVAWPL